ncbi:hypothetical protein L596_018886 [Steinernema carpocapsae]|uniref:Pseudouridylate synthase RPUSD4, mitochondrial n=1 Tax=Steinernema carpocapsae TaxID=34508 RepID=A0A4U5N6I5_STECR|nr:hypothetical protein L596_018886 [Steinernema carpocapsae]
MGGKDDFFGIKYLEEESEVYQQQRKNEVEIKAENTDAKKVYAMDFIDSAFFPELKSKAEATKVADENKLSANFFEDQFFGREPTRREERSSFEEQNEDRFRRSEALKPTDSDDFFTQQLLSHKSRTVQDREPFKISGEEEQRMARAPKKAKRESRRTQEEKESSSDDFAMTEATSRMRNGLKSIYELIDPVWKFDEEVLLDMMTERMIYEDETLIAFDKPYQMAYSGAKQGQAQLDKLLRKLRERIAPDCQHLHLVRSLDKASTGVVLFAKTDERRSQLREAYEEGRVEQNYRCLVHNIPEENNATINIPLVKLINGRDMRLENVKNPRTKLEVFNVSTSYEVINSSHATNCSLIGATVSKDISNQVRAHLAYGTGCTLIGDYKYNLKTKGEPPRLSPKALDQLNLRPHDYRKVPMFMHLNQLLIPRAGKGSKYISIRAPVPHFFHYALKKLHLLKR